MNVGALELDAARLREMTAQEFRNQEAIAAQLMVTRDREEWSTRELAKWCRTNDVGIESQATVVRLLGYHRIVSALRENELIPVGITPSEGLLRPIVQAMNKGLTIDQAFEVWEYHKADSTKSIRAWLAIVAPKFGPKPRPPLTPPSARARTTMPPLRELIREYGIESVAAGFQRLVAEHERRQLRNNQKGEAA